MKNVFLSELQRIGVCKKNKILLALSGGIDSMVLCHLLMKSKFTFSIAHCNFSLRSIDSDADAKFVQLFAKSNKKECFLKKFNTENYAKKNKLSIQMAARELRYEWVSFLKKKYQFDFIATAHHMNDSVETLLINLIRGTGIAGLHGITNNNFIIRPLFPFCKKDIINYAVKHSVIYREDKSNKDDKYVRNNIRHNIIPLMEQLNPKLIYSIGKTILRLKFIIPNYNFIIKFHKTYLNIFFYTISC